MEHGHIRYVGLDSEALGVGAFTLKASALLRTLDKHYKLGSSMYRINSRSQKPWELSRRPYLHLQATSVVCLADRSFQVSQLINLLGPQNILKHIRKRPFRESAGCPNVIYQQDYLSVRDRFDTSPSRQVTTYPRSRWNSSPQTNRVPSQCAESCSPPVARRNLTCVCNPIR